MAFQKNRYKDDYKYERYYTPSGRIKYRTVYVGKSYVYAAGPEALHKDRVLFGAVCAVLWALLLVSLFLNGLLGRLWWVVMPQAFVLIPLSFLTGGVWRFLFSKTPLDRESGDIVSGRPATCCAFQFVLHGVSFLGGVVSVILFRAFLVMPDDILFLILDAALFALNVLLYKRRGGLAVKETK